MLRKEKLIVNSFIILILSLFAFSCSPQKIINPQRYNFIQAKNQITTDYALIATIEHTTIVRLQQNQIPISRAENIDKFIKQSNFRLDLAKKLLEAGNYKESYSISHDEYKKLQTLLKSLKGEMK